MFVTLEIAGRLRGCIGSLQPHQALADDVRRNAYKAAFADPRFPKLSAEEAGQVSIAVSVLSLPQALQAPSEEALLAQLRPHQDGLVLRDGARSALFLPSVWQSIPEPRDFVRQLRRKAGMPTDGWSESMRAERFGVEWFSTQH